MGGTLRIKTFSETTNFTIIDNTFDKGYADFGAFFDIEVNFNLIASNNIFSNGLCISYFGNGIGTGSTLIMSAGKDTRYSVYNGNNNTYLHGFSENRGFFLFFKLKNMIFLLIGGLAAMFGGNFTEKNSIFMSNYGYIAGTFFTTQLAIAKFFNCIFLNETSTNSGNFH